MDLYSEDLDKEYSVQIKDEFCGDGVDLYDDIGGPVEPVVSTSAAVSVQVGSVDTSVNSIDGGDTTGSNGIYHQNSASIGTSQAGRRHQLYVGNLTWWTTDLDIERIMVEIGVNDFVEVKFFENRCNGQSKGFCVVTLGSDASVRTVLERLPTKEMYGQTPVVTYPTKQALNQFEAQQKTRPVPQPQQNGPPRGPAPMAMGVGSSIPPNTAGPGVPPGHVPRMMNPNMGPNQYRPHHMSQGPPVGPNPGMQRMQPLKFKPVGKLIIKCNIIEMLKPVKCK